MPEHELSKRPYLSLWPFCRMVAAASEDARLLELDGVIATIVPATPERSITNSVAYENTGALEQALDQLASAYHETGIRAWTVWVPERDRAAQDLLEGLGHELDARPAGMALELGEFDRAPSLDFELDRDPPAVDVGRLNDAAYGFDEEFTRAFARLPDELNVYAARVDGEAIACVGSIHDDGDCGIYMVATHPAARGRGLARELMTAALRDGRSAGCESASLQSTAMGKPLYARLGFRDFGAIQMWEKRAT
jgi:GNAT superfamily N-acetyltransferase